MFHSRMNRLPKSIVLMLLGVFVLGAALWPQPASAMRHSRWQAGLQIDVGDFDYLSEYGEWVDTREYGMVWYPYVVDEWSPFFHGHWSWTHDGWAWISYEPFGWLVFHYGYWYYEQPYGWFWVPGRIWAPARVQWYTYGDYCAWAPMPPPHRYWRHHPWDRDGFNVWITVGFDHFTSDYVGNHRIRRPIQEKTIYRSSWMKEPPRHRDVERIVKRALPPVRISRERVDFRPDASKVPTRYYRPKAIERTKMIVPERDADRVRQNSPKVEREVLVPRDKAPKREPQRASEKPAQKRSDDRQKKTIKRR